MGGEDVVVGVGLYAVLGSWFYLEKRANENNNEDQKSTIVEKQ